MSRRILITLLEDKRNPSQEKYLWLSALKTVQSESRTTFNPLLNENWKGRNFSPLLEEKRKVE